jgi:hypothetical protein
MPATKTSTRHCSLPAPKAMSRFLHPKPETLNPQPQTPNPRPLCVACAQGHVELPPRGGGGGSCRGSGLTDVEEPHVGVRVRILDCVYARA